MTCPQSDAEDSRLETSFSTETGEPPSRHSRSLAAVLAGVAAALVIGTIGMLVLLLILGGGKGRSLRALGSPPGSGAAELADQQSGAGPTTGTALQTDASRPQTGSAPATPLQRVQLSDSEMVGDVVERWRAAWEECRLDDLIECFWPDATVDGRSMQAYRAYHKWENIRQPNKHVGLSELRISLDGDTAEATFVQDFHGSGPDPQAEWTSRGEKTLILEKRDDRWRIIGQRFTKSWGRHR